MTNHKTGHHVYRIVNPTTAEWDLSIKDADYKKMLKGFTPQQMEDRWICLADEPDADGNTVLHMARSWTGEEQISLTITAAKNDEGTSIGKLTWQTNNYDSEEEVKELAVNICKHLLGCDMENA